MLIKHVLIGNQNPKQHFVIQGKVNQCFFKGQGCDMYTETISQITALAMC